MCSSSSRSSSHWRARSLTVKMSFSASKLLVRLEQHLQLGNSIVLSRQVPLSKWQHPGRDSPTWGRPVCSKDRRGGGGIGCRS